MDTAGGYGEAAVLVQPTIQYLAHVLAGLHAKACPNHSGQRTANEPSSRGSNQTADHESANLSIAEPASLFGQSLRVRCSFELAIQVWRCGR